MRIFMYVLSHIYPFDFRYVTFMSPFHLILIRLSRLIVHNLFSDKSVISDCHRCCILLKSVFVSCFFFFCWDFCQYVRKICYGRDNVWGRCRAPQHNKPKRMHQHNHIDKNDRDRSGTCVPIDKCKILCIDFESHFEFYAAQKLLEIFANYAIL